MENNTSIEIKDDKTQDCKTEQKKIIISENELKIIINTIIVCSKRGAFQLEEYEVISYLYKSLMSHIESKN